MEMKTQWYGKRVAFLGDSITDACHVGTEKNYWQYLQEYLGIEPLVYGINGHQWLHIPDQARQLYQEHEDNVDAIMVFAGTNDFNSSTQLGEWYSYSMKAFEYMGTQVPRRHRVHQMTQDTFRGRINLAMAYLKETFPCCQIVLLTPIHRAFARFADTNIQPEEAYANFLGYFIDDYVQVLKEAGNVWSVPVIDLNSISGLYPMAESHHHYFHLADTDLLHPASSGHERMALSLMYSMQALPAAFPREKKDS